MASLEWRVINELIRSKDMNSVAKLGFNADHLAGEPEAAQIFDFIRSWYHNPNTAGLFPTLHAIKKRHPSFTKTGDYDRGDLRSLLAECKAAAVVSDLRTLAAFFQEMVDEQVDDPELVIKSMQSQLSKSLYSAQMTSGFSIREIANSVRSQYEGAGTGAIYGIPWVWDVLTEDTLGKHKEDFIVLYGRMKSMKTWVLMVNAIHDFIVNKRRVLIWSREMNQAKMSLRAGSILAGVDYQCLKNGTLPSPLYEKATVALNAMVGAMRKSEKMLQRLEKEKDYEASGGADLFIVCGRGAPRSLEAFDAVVRAFSPDVIYLDSMYHMDCASMLKMKSDHERQRELAIQLKQRAVDWDVPVIGTTQANREGDKTHGETMVDVGRTDALAQEADLIIRVLHRMGPEPSENDYEGFWKSLKSSVPPPTQRNGVHRNGRMRLGMSEAAAKRFSKTNGVANGHSNGVPEKIMKKFDRLPKEPRKAAELYLMMGGNREGVLEGFAFRCIPGYTWGPTRIVKKEEVKEIFFPDKRKGGKGKKSSSSGEGKRAPVLNPAESGYSYKSED